VVLGVVTGPLPQVWELDGLRSTGKQRYGFSLGVPVLDRPDGAECEFSSMRIKGRARLTGQPFDAARAGSTFRRRSRSVCRALSFTSRGVYIERVLSRRLAWRETTRLDAPRGPGKRGWRLSRSAARDGGSSCWRGQRGRVRVDLTSTIVGTAPGLRQGRPRHLSKLCTFRRDRSRNRRSVGDACRCYP
jgi:hypothetical protein